MIEIDDAGGGCFIGPEVLAIHRLETDEVWYVLISPQEPDRILSATILLSRAFTTNGILPNEPIKLCRGDIFDLFEVWLRRHGYQVFREKVSDATDELAERKFMDILHSYGLPVDLELHDRGYREFYDCIALWYFLNPNKGLRRYCKVRLHPPMRSKRLAERFPNLLGIIFGETDNAEKAFDGTA